MTVLNKGRIDPLNFAKNSEQYTSLVLLHQDLLAEMCKKPNTLSYDLNERIYRTLSSELLMMLPDYSTDVDAIRKNIKDFGLHWEMSYSSRNGKYNVIVYTLNKSNEVAVPYDMYSNEKLEYALLICLIKVLLK